MIEMHERIATMENEVKNLKDSNDKSHKAMMTKLDTFIDTCDDRYAPKWMMTILSYLAGIVAVVISAGVIKYLW